MSRSASLLRVVSAAAAVAGIGLLVWWFVVGQDTSTPIAAPEADATVAPTATAGPAPTATPVPTPTPVPSPTPVPTPLPFAEAAPLGELAAALSTPLPDCGLLRNDAIVAGAVTLTCIEEWASVPVVSVADGRVVNVVRSPAIQPSDESPAAVGWSWAEQAELGPHVVVDHGPLGGSSNTQTVYAGLSMIDEGIAIGALIGAGEPLGSVAGPEASLLFSIWSNDQRQDGVRVLADGPPADEQRAVALALRDVIGSPTDERCPLVLNFGSLPGAPRQYRNGTHRGVDFGCGDADRSAFAIADGTVVYLVDDYADPSVGEREALLQQAGIAGFTPHWTLVMLYGNVVVVDHGDIPGAGRVVTISAHLEEVDPSISIGAQVTSGQRLGELGNRGTNASAQGIRGAADPSLHLHWELFIDNWYLGAGLDGPTTVEVMATALCGAAQTAGCPA